jgi:hypothetical protein
MCNKVAEEKGDGMGWENVGHVMGLEGEWVVDGSSGRISRGQKMVR